MNQTWSEMTLNYQKIMKRYPKPNGTVGGLIPDYEMFPSLDEKNLPRWSRASCVPKQYISFEILKIEEEEEEGR
jgi:hypothetical protein